MYMCVCVLCTNKCMSSSRNFNSTWLIRILERPFEMRIVYAERITNEAEEMLHEWIKGELQKQLTETWYSFNRKKILSLALDFNHCKHDMDNKPNQAKPTYILYTVGSLFIRTLNFITSKNALKCLFFSLFLSFQSINWWFWLFALQPKTNQHTHKHTLTG